MSKSVVARSVPFDNSANGLIAENLQDVIEEISEMANGGGSSIFGEEIEIATYNNNIQTTSSEFIDALAFNQTDAPAGTYIIMWSYRAHSAKADTTCVTEPRFQDLAVQTNIVIGIDPSLSLGGGKGELFSGFGQFTINDVPNLKISIAIKRSAGTGWARVNSMSLMIFRII